MRLARASAAAALASTAIVILGAGACRRAVAPLGEADSYVVYEPAAAPVAAGAAAESGPEAHTLPRFREVRLDDQRAAPIHRIASDGFLGELLRTDYLAKQLIRDGWQGKSFSVIARAQAQEPTALILAGSRMARADEATLGVGFATVDGGFGIFGGAAHHPRVMWIETGDDPLADPAFVQTASGRVARLIAERLARAADEPGGPSGAAAARALIDGYALAMEVIGREWRVGEGPQGSLPPSAGTGTQRERFAGVRSNAFVMVPGDLGTLRPAAEMLTDSGVVAAVIHRMAQSTGVGRKVAPPEIYAPFVGQRVPPGISPAAVLGPIRNFQVKLLCAWAGAILSGHPPRDLVDLITAYAQALPAERSDLYRIFVVTTYGATVKVGGVSPKPANATAALAELTVLSAEVSAGRRTLRAALPQ
jgi:hypothetical protein